MPLYRKNLFYPRSGGEAKDFQSIGKALAKRGAPGEIPSNLSNLIIASINKRPAPLDNKRAFTLIASQIQGALGRQT